MKAHPYGAALQRQSPLYPVEWVGRVPHIVRMLRTVAADEHAIAHADQKYEVLVNSDGRVRALLPRGDTLAIAHDCFSVVSWHMRPLALRMDDYNYCLKITPDRQCAVFARYVRQSEIDAHLQAGLPIDHLEPPTPLCILTLSQDHYATLKRRDEAIFARQVSRETQALINVKCACAFSEIAALIRVYVPDA